MADKTWNKNVRFNMNSEDAVQAWSLLQLLNFGYEKEYYIGIKVKRR
ncbi:MAG: hypothetical protein ACI4D0_10625 [Lachnospira sp.]